MDNSIIPTTTEVNISLAPLLVTEFIKQDKKHYIFKKKDGGVFNRVEKAYLSESYSGGLQFIDEPVKSN